MSATSAPGHHPSVNVAIQGLRGIAILLVLLNHAGVPWFQGGYVGVDIFFVISGYLIGGLLTKEAGRTGSIELLAFYARRSRRLVPALLVLLLFVLGVERWLYAPIEQAELFSSARAAALYLANFWFTTRTTDYFAGHADANPLLHLWSLAVEEQFYLFLPALVWLLARRRWTSRAAHATIAVGLLAVSFALCVWTTRQNQPMAFFGMPWRTWEFALGWLVFLQRERLERLTVGGLSFIGLLSWAAVIVVTVFFEERLLFPGAWAALPAAAAAGLLVVAGDGRAVVASRMLANGALRWLGDASYSLYLWHWPLLLFAQQLWPASGWQATLCAVLLSLLLGRASYVWIENPARQRLLPSARPRHVVSVGVLSCLLVAGCATLLSRLGSELPDSGLLRARSERPEPTRRDCHASYAVQDLSDCSFAAVGAPRRVVLFGDSHALQWFPALEQLALKHGWQLTSLTKSGCPILDVPVELQALHRDYWECTEWRSRMIKRLTAMKPDLVVLASATSYRVGAQDWADALERRLTEWQREGQAFVMLRDTPKLDFDVPVCLARAQWRQIDVDKACSFPRSDRKTWRLEFADAEMAVLSKLGLTQLDMSSAICGQQACSTLIQGKALCMDDNHLSVAFARTLAPALEDRLRAAWAAPHDQVQEKLFSR